MPSILPPSIPTNYQHLPLELREKIAHQVVTDVLTSPDATPHAGQPAASPVKNPSPNEVLRNRSSRLFALMTVNAEFMTQILNDLRRFPDPKVRKSLNVIALNSILRECNPKIFENLMRNMLKSATHIDLSHRSVAISLSSERLAFIVDQLATASASNLETAVLHISKTKEWVDVKEKAVQIFQKNPNLSIHVSFSDKAEPGSLLPPPDLSAVLSENKNIKGLTVFRVLHSYGDSPAQFFSFLPASSITELTLHRVSTSDLQGLGAVLLAPGCKLHTLNLGKESKTPWSEGVATLTPVLENPASPVKKIQLHGPCRTDDAIPFLNAAGNDNSPLKELDFSGVSAAGTFVREIQNQVAPLTARGIKITLPDQV